MVSDSELAIAAASGDRGALADIYDRYANTLHELCRVILGDPHEASDALQDTFVIAATRLGGLRDPSRLKPWLCAIARHESIRRSSRRARNRPARDEVLDVPVNDVAASGLIADDAANLVWQSAEALTERERTVLMLNVRQGLEGAELAAAAGMPGPATSVLLSRAKTQLATAVRCTLLIRNGREDCTELASIVPRKHAALDGLTRKRVARHATGCAICSPKWNQTPEALGVLAVAPLLGAPVALRHKVLNDPRLISFSSPLGDGQWEHDGFPPHEEEQESPRRVLAWLAAAAVVLTIAVGLVWAGNDEPRSLAAPSDDTTTTGVEDFAPWPTDPPGSRVTTTTRKGATTTTRRATTTRPNAGGATPTTQPPPTTTTEPRLTISASASPSPVPCRGSSTVTAQTHNRELRSGEVLLLQWRDASGSGGGTNMTQTGSSWTGTLPHWTRENAGQNLTWWVEARQGFSGVTARTSNHTIAFASC